MFNIPANAASIDVYLTVPARRPRHTLVTSDLNRADIRYVERLQEVPDEFDPAQTQQIEIMDKNFRFVLSGEPLDGLVGIKIAEIFRSAEGLVQLRKDYVPPAVRVNASAWLDRMARELLGVIAARSRSLTEERRRFGNEAMDFNPTTILTFWFLHTLNLHAPVIQHLLDTPGTHPAALYQELLRLGGGLATFGLKNSTDLPAYNHEAIGDCFSALIRWLREILAHLFQTRYEIIPLVKKDSFWIGHIGDAELRATGTFILAATGTLAPQEIVGKLPNALKIAEIDGIERLVRTHVGGVRVQHLVRPPNAIPIRNDAIYFRILSEGPDWERIKATGQLAAYVPTWLPGIQIELIGVRAGGGQ
jgi:type VI secretion system protein ImpJ